MPRAINRLSPRKVESTKWKASKGDKGGTRPIMLADGGGLLLRLTKDNTKSWVFRYQRDKQRHDHGLGAFPTVTLRRAREKAEDLRRALADGRDPIREKTEARSAHRLAQGRNVSF